ncbi:hypothetical protein O3M35_003893 [Rhynocoris fuscipes]|uniref:Phosphoribosylformylglycinamidine synthase n=1 Tax=Rhynocoris fuscipes TaxID=488301 RepID=A0AAW1CMF1_9HEMI
MDASCWPHLGWVGGYVHSGELQNGVFLDRNLSERFECRFTTVKINKTPSIMLKDMEGSVLGVWVAHGEGRFSYKNDRVHRVLGSNKCIALQYVDDNGEPTELYPMNPNGSKDGIAGICSLDGRHLALMPHPERATFMWQWPYVPPNLVGVEISPWMRLFYNAFVWTHNVL